MAVATPTPVNAVTAPQRSRASIVLGMLWRDKFATVAVIFLLLVILCAIFGPAWLGDAAVRQNLRGRNAPPFSLQQGWLFVLGADALGGERRHGVGEADGNGHATPGVGDDERPAADGRDLRQSRTG